MVNSFNNASRVVLSSDRKFSFAVCVCEREGELGGKVDARPARQAAVVRGPPGVRHGEFYVGEHVPRKLVNVDHAAEGANRLGAALAVAVGIQIHRPV